jgi:hypothetical protein
MKHTNILCGQNAALHTVKVRGTYSYQRALKCRNEKCLRGFK